MYALPPLPYELDALMPVISVETMRFHYGKHHARYVEVTNEITGKTAQPLEDVIAGARERGEAKLFNNAAQAWNHAFFWESMSFLPTLPSADLQRAIDSQYGTREGLKQQFVAKGAAQFGSGWVWLLSTGGKLEVVTSHDAEQPWLGTASVPLLVCDVWEHAYYLDYKNARDRFLATWFDGLANWAFASEQLQAGTRYRYPAPG
jgi:Fe-Mn family superoxide dismutase